MAHRDFHPTPVEHCFGCKVSGLGFQGLQSRQGPDPVHHIPVVGEEGTAGGKLVGRHDEHWDGRQDATVFAPTISIETKTRELR